MKRELLKAYHRTVLFFENTEGLTDCPEDYVLSLLPAGAETVQEEVRRVAALYGCDHIRSSFNEESYYIFKNADDALSAMIAAEKADQEPQAEPAPEPEEQPEQPAGLDIPEDLLSAVVTLCDFANPWDFEESMIPDVRQNLSDYPWETVAWLEEDFLRYPGDVPEDMYKLARETCLRIENLMNENGVSANS